MLPENFLEIKLRNCFWLIVKGVFLCPLTPYKFCQIKDLMKYEDT